MTIDFTVKKCPGTREQGRSFTEDVASELSFNKEKCLVDKRGEDTAASQEEQQHTQVARAGP